MNTSTIDAIAKAIRETEEASEKRRKAVEALAAKAEQARTEASRHDAEVTELENRAAQPVSTPLYEILQNLTREVADARSAAIDAVRTGERPALEAWLDYRRLRSRNRGVWDAMQSEWQRTTGHKPPLGAWGPPTRPDTSGLDDPNQAAESFEQFLHAAIVWAESDIRAETFAATSNELEQARSEQTEES